MTESRFIDCFSDLGNGCERYENGKKIEVYTLLSVVNNQFNLSYHLKFPQKNVQFNFWYDKVCYLNSNASVTISLYNGNEKNPSEQLKRIFKTSIYGELKSKIEDILINNKN